MGRVCPTTLQKRQAASKGSLDARTLFAHTAPCAVRGARAALPPATHPACPGPPRGMVVAALLYIAACQLPVAFLAPSHDSAASHDTAIGRCLAAPFGRADAPLPLQPARAARLALRFGGLGLCAADTVATAMFAKMEPSARAPSLLAAIQAASAEPPMIATSARSRRTLVTCPLRPASYALLLSQAGPRSARASTVLPTSEDVGVPASQFRVLLLLRLRLPLPVGPGSCSCSHPACSPPEPSNAPSLVSTRRPGRVSGKLRSPP